MSLRVISGKSGGLLLKSLKGMQTRPTADRIKESLFSIIGSLLDGSAVLDLFAGSGALGIEALSRGAKTAIFVDASKESINIIKENVRHTGFQETSEIYHNDYERAIKALSQNNIKFDIIFLDPPYGKGMEIKAVESIIQKNLISDKGIIIIETEEILADNIFEMKKYDERSYGRTKLSFFMKEKAY
ncbi:MAG: 16S rRNA (guanine(966)-N(2))-methyltransferase RsmD [Ignavibacteriales bacterium]